MQQITERNARSGNRPLLWLTLALHLGIAAFLYLHVSGDTSTPSNSTSQTTEQTAKP
jgi:hypothetical protein